MAEIEGYVNPRTQINDTSAQDIFALDVFFEQSLWYRYIDDERTDTMHARVWDVVWMLRTQCSPVEVQQGGQRFKVYLGHRKVTLKAYTHPNILALCVGIAT